MKSNVIYSKLIYIIFILNNFILIKMFNEDKTLYKNFAVFFIIKYYNLNKNKFDY